METDSDDNGKYQEFLEHQFTVQLENQYPDETDIISHVNQISQRFVKQMIDLISQQFVIAKKRKRISFQVIKRIIKIKQDFFFQQINSEKYYDNPVFYTEEIPKQYKLKGYNFFLPLLFNQRLIVVQLKDQEEKQQLEKYIIWNNYKKSYESMIKDLTQKQARYFQKNCILVQFQKQLRWQMEKRIQNLKKILQKSYLLNNYNKCLAQNLKKITPQIIQRSICNKNYVCYEKQQEVLQYQRKKLQLNSDGQTIIIKNDVKFIFYYIDCEEYNDQNKPSIEDAILKISIIQNEQQKRKIDNKTKNDIIYYEKQITLKEMNKKCVKIEVDFLLQKYNDQDTLQFSIKGKDIKISNQYPIYLFLDKFEQGQKYYIYISDGLYINFESQFIQTDYDQKIKNQIKNKEQLIEPIYCDKFLQLSQDYHKFLSDQQNSEQDYNTLIYELYTQHVKKISKQWIINNDQVQQIQQLIQKLKIQKKETQQVQFVNFYQEINYYYDYLNDKSLYNPEIQHYNDKILLSGLTNNIRIDFYKQYGIIQTIIQKLLLQIRYYYLQNVYLNGVYEFIKKNINYNCVLQQKLRDDLNNLNISNQLIHNAISSWISIIQLFTFNNTKLQYGQYIIQYALKLQQIIMNHEFYKQCPNISEELTFFLILSQSIFFNYDFQNKIDQNEEINELILIREIQPQNITTNQKSITGLIFLRYSIKYNFPNIYTLIEKYKINVELLFCDSLQQLCFDLLNSNMYYRILDIAYGLISEGLGYLHFAVVLAILSQFQEKLDYVKSYQSFIDILKFTAYNIYNETVFINDVLLLRIDLDKEYLEFTNLINKQNIFYLNNKYKQEAIQSIDKFDITNLSQIVQKYKKNIQKTNQNESKIIHIFTQHNLQIQENQVDQGYLKLQFQQSLIIVFNNTNIKIDCNSLPLNILIQQKLIENIDICIIIECEQQDIDQKIPQEYIKEFFNLQQQLYGEHLSQNILIKESQWIQGLFIYQLDSNLDQKQFKNIMQEIFKKQNLDQIWTNFDKNKFYFKEFLIHQILNSVGSLKQKMFYIYQSFKSLNKNIFDMKMMIEILQEIFHINKIPILKQELFNHIIFQNEQNKIQNVKFQLGNDNLDVSDIFQKSLQTDQLKNDSIILVQTIIDDLKNINQPINQHINITIENQQMMQTSQENLQEKTQNLLIDQIQELKKQNQKQTIQLIINYSQNFQNFQLKYNLNDELQIINSNEIVLNVQNYELQFKEFWNICNQLKILNFLIKNQSQEKPNISCKFQIYINDQEIMQLKFFQESQNQLITLNEQQYQQNLQKFIEDNQQPLQNYEIQTDQLDILLPLNQLYKQISNILIIHHLDKPIPYLKNADLMSQPKINIQNQIAPYDIDDLSLFDIQEFSGYKNLEIKITFKSLEIKSLQNKKDTKI